MKKLFTFLFLLVGFTVSAQSIEFDVKSMDFGKIKKGVKADTVFVIKNTGEKPLIVQKVTPSCGCTVAEAPKLPIMPKDSFSLKVGYDTKRVGAFQKVISVLSNDPEKGRQLLTIKGEVIED